MRPEEIDRLARIVWDYHLMKMPLTRSDVMLVLGSNDLRVASYSARLYREGWAPLVVFSGGLGNLTRGKWLRPEADCFAEAAMTEGVPREVIRIENRSTNTGDNILFSKALLESEGIRPESILLVHTPYSERRDYAAFKNFWPSPRFSVSSPPLSFDDYIQGEITRNWLISIIVGDLQRIHLYPGKGFQIPQKIPTPVWDAYETLVSIGYTDYLIQS